jgi:imidazolonepropionase-like amidohydrolase
MQLRHLTAACILAAFAVLPLPAVGADLALIHCNVFDGVKDGIRKDSTVLVSGGRIERIADDGAGVPPDYEKIDCEGHYLAPGLIDVHTHLDNSEAMRRALDSGTTTVRSASVPAFQDVGLRELVRAGALPGPDVVAAGRLRHARSGRRHPGRSAVGAAARRRAD